MLDDLFRPILTFLLRLLFGVEVRGMEHFRAAGDRVLIVCNHQSYLDPLLLAVLIPQKPAFAMNVAQADKWYFRWCAKIVKIYRLDPMHPLSMKVLIQDLRKGAKVVLFPEGRITTSGGIMKIYDGAGMIVEKTGATLLPMHIDGAQYSMLSRLDGKLRRRWLPKIRLTVGAPQRFAEGEKVKARAIYDLLTQTAFDASRWRRSFLSAVLESAQLHGSNHTVAADFSGASLTYRQLFARAFILSNKLEPKLAGHSHVGMMLPSAIAAAVTFVSLHMLRIVPCMLNFSSGEAQLQHACRIARVKTILTSRAFIEKGKLEAVAAALAREHTILYLEDLRPSISLINKLAGLIKAHFAHHLLAPKLAGTHPDETAVVLYTSGSEGAPKGVALSHANILANIQQVCARLDITSADRLFNAMPVFHSFGLVIGMLMPLAKGVYTYLYPTPLHYRVIPELVYDTDATIMLGTDTFLNGYAHYAHPYDFWRVRLAVVGAEKLKYSTYQRYMERFRLPILQGYGVTEASPVISCNTPLEAKVGTVGRIFPGMEAKLETIPGLEEGKRLFVKGPNIMLGYLKADQPGIIQPQGEWYDTGDIVSIDDEGFITIQGRAKRFAKIGGEMVSLLAVEELASGLAPEIIHAAIAVPDDRKGEQIILFTESKTLTREQLAHHARAAGFAEIGLPKKVVLLDAIPRLGNGKIDYQSLQKLDTHTA